MKNSTEKLIQEMELQITPVFRNIEAISYQNQRRVLEAFRTHRVSPSHFVAGTGYGYNDIGRETLESMYATIFGGEDALVRSQMISGTHVLSICLFALLDRGDLLVSAMGPPYDTLRQIITGKNGLVERGVHYVESPVTENGSYDRGQLVDVAAMNPRVVLLQRSRGYSSKRKTLTINELSEVIKIFKDTNPEIIVLVDNCYGEFVESREPSHIGADLTVGSLIKNPGGGLAVGGGYIVGPSDLVETVADHLIAPGLGKEIGPSLYDLRTVYQGLFLAPHIVGEALKGVILAAAVLARLGIKVFPQWHEDRGDIVQVVQLYNLKQVQSFVHTVQAYSPVDSYVMPEFGSMPGYKDDVIMAAGTFVQGSSIELSCDAPRREPYLAFLQGGLSYQHTRYVVGQLVDMLKESLDGIIP